MYLRLGKEILFNYIQLCFCFICGLKLTWLHVLVRRWKLKKKQKIWWFLMLGNSIVKCLFASESATASNFSIWIMAQFTFTYVWSMMIEYSKLSIAWFSSLHHWSKKWNTLWVSTCLFSYSIVDDSFEPHSVYQLEQICKSLFG